jgi:hypothetical protein
VPVKADTTSEASTTSVTARVSQAAPAQAARYSILVAIGVGSSTVRPTVHSRACDW